MVPVIAMTKRRRRKNPQILQTPNVAFFDPGIAMLALSLDHLTTVHRALQYYAGVRDPEVDPEGLAFELAEMIRPMMPR